MSCLKWYVFCVPNEAGGIVETGFDILLCQLRIIFLNDPFWGHACFKKLKDQVYHDSSVLNTGLPVTNIGINYDSFC